MIHTHITPATERGNWIITYTGKRFFPLDPRPDEICIEDIAHALSNVCRFGGHVRTFYSVAQHCVLAARYVDGDLALKRWALLHDASEAYLGDMVKPLKNTMHAFEEVERNVMEVIARKFGLEPFEPLEVIEIDRRLCVTEARDLIGANVWWNPWLKIQPFPSSIVACTPQEAERAFLQCMKDFGA